MDFFVHRWKVRPWGCGTWLCRDYPDASEDAYALSRDGIGSDVYVVYQHADDGHVETFLTEMWFPGCDLPLTVAMTEKISEEV